MVSSYHQFGKWGFWSWKFAAFPVFEHIIQQLRKFRMFKISFSSTEGKASKNTTLSWYVFPTSPAVAHLTDLGVLF
jgi:hypothetical protein